MALQDDSVQHEAVLLLLKGHPGSGKSTLAAGLARALRWPLVDKDDVRDCTYDVENVLNRAHEGSSEANRSLSTAKDSSAILNALSYSVMWRIASRQLGLGLSVIVDCPLARPSLFWDGVELCEKHNARIGVIECRPGDVKEWARRLEERGSNPDSNLDCNYTAPEVCDQSVQDTDVIFPNVVKGNHSGVLGGNAQWSGCDITSDSLDAAPYRSNAQAFPPRDNGRNFNSADQMQRDTSSAGWHKPTTWHAMKTLLEKYDGCWEYSFEGSPHIVLDTTSMETNILCEKVLEWLREVFKVPRVGF